MIQTVFYSTGYLQNYDANTMTLKKSHENIFESNSQELLDAIKSQVSFIAKSC